MKKFYFPHDENAANDERLLKLRAQFGNAEGYGMWWMLLEHLVRNQGYLEGDAVGVLSISYGLDSKKVAQFLEFCVSVRLIEKDKKGLFNSRLMEHINLMNKKIEGGHEGAKRRWGSRKKGIRTPNNSPIKTPNAEERIGEDRREDDIKKPTKKAENKTMMSDEETEKLFYPIAVEFSDAHYADKTMKQLHDLRSERRDEVYRKMRVAINSAKHPATHGLAKKIFHEIAGAVNDFGAMEKQLDAKEAAQRREFAREESGEVYVREELNTPPDVF